MKHRMQDRQLLSATVIFLYLIPLFFFSYYSIGLMSHDKSWSILSIGLLIVTGGSLTLYFFICYWEEALRSKMQTSTSLAENESKVTSLEPALNESLKELHLLQTNLKESHDLQLRLHDELNLKTFELQKSQEDHQMFSAKAEQIGQEFIEYKIFSEEQLKQKNLQVNLLQQTIEEQREVIQQLTTKVNDLGYEIKTLLYLQENEPKPAEIPSKIQPIKPIEEVEDLTRFASDTQVRSHGDALMLLRRCVNTAEKLLGHSYYGSESSRYFEPSLPHYTIDQRRLFDVLRNENGAVVFVYSQRDDKMLFVNNQVKTLLGWSPEKFVSEFFAFLADGQTAWQEAMHQLSSDNEAQARLLIKSKEGQDVIAQCQLGTISAGLFKNHVIGILY